MLIVAFVLIFNNKSPKDSQQLVSNSEQNLPAATPTPTPEPTATGTKKLSYTEAVKTYKYRYQFVNCSANPGTLSVKRNTPVMLDNRDKKSHTIRVSGQTIAVAALDYQLLYPKTEGTFQMTCDGGGTAVLNVEK